VEAVSDFAGAGDDLVERNIRRGVEVKNQAARLLGFERLTVPRVQLQPGNLGGSN
jgi:hypothetical protein